MKLLQISILLVTLITCDSLVARTLSVRTWEVTRNQDLPERYVKVADKYVELSFSFKQPGEFLQATAGEATLPLYELIKEPDGKPSYKIAEEIKLPEGAEGVLLMGWKGADGPRYFGIDDDFSAKKYDDWLLINAATKEVTLQLGKVDKEIMIEADSSMNHKINAQGGKGIAVVGKAKWREKLKTFYSTFWSYNPEQRGMIIFFYDQGDRVGLKKIQGMLLKPRETENPVNE
jgi:hypothetical protein